MASEQTQKVTIAFIKRRLISPTNSFLNKRFNNNIKTKIKQMIEISTILSVWKLSNLMITKEIIKFTKIENKKLLFSNVNLKIGIKINKAPNTIISISILKNLMKKSEGNSEPKIKI